MKTTMKFAAIAAAALAICSCGAPKQATNATTSESTNTTTYAEQRTEEILEPWFELQSQATVYLRGAGTGVSTAKVVAIEQAKLTAIGDLTNEIAQTCENTRRIIMHDMGLNDEHKASTEFAADIKTKASEKISMNHALMTKTYRLANGSYECGYCFEMDMSKAEFKEYLAKEIGKSIGKAYENVKGLDKSGEEAVKEGTQRAQDILNF